MIANRLWRRTVGLTAVATACLLIATPGAQGAENLVVGGTLRDAKFERLNKAYAVVASHDGKKTHVYWQTTDSLGRFRIIVPKVEKRRMHLFVFHPVAGAALFENLSQDDAQAISSVLAPPQGETERETLERWLQLVPQYPAEMREQLKKELEGYRDKRYPPAKKG